MQTFVFSFCQCAVWQSELSNGDEQAGKRVPAADSLGGEPVSAETLVAMSGSNTQDIELWDMEVMGCHDGPQCNAHLSKALRCLTWMAMLTVLHLH